MDQQLKIWDLWLEKLAESGQCDERSEIRRYLKKATSKKTDRYPLTGREIRNVLILTQTIALAKNKSKKVTMDDFERVYQYKMEFRQETEDQRRLAQKLLSAETS